MPLTIAHLKHLVIEGDVDTILVIQNNPALAADLIQELLLQTGQKLGTNFPGLVAKYPERYYLKGA